MICVRLGAVADRHRGRTVAMAITGGRGTGERSDGRQCGHRHRDDDGRVVAAAVDHVHTHLGGSGNHGTSRLVLADGEVVCSDAVIVRHLTYGISQIRNRKFALCLVDVGCNLAAEATHIHFRLRLVLYIICICPCLLRIIASSVFIGIDNLAVAGEGRGLQFLVDKHRIERAAAAVCDSREAAVQHHRRSRQIKCQRGGGGDALDSFLAVSRKGPCAGVDRHHTTIAGFAVLGIHTGVSHSIGVLAAAIESGRIQRQAAGIASSAMGVIVRGHGRFITVSIHKRPNSGIIS